MKTIIKLSIKNQIFNVGDIVNELRGVTENTISHPYNYLCNKIKILVVNSNREIYESINEYLNKYYLYHADLTDCIYIAENRLKKKQYHICLLDMGMEDINNDECTFLKKYSYKIPIIAFSGLKDPKFGFDIHRLGATDICSLPINFGSIELVEIINATFLDLLIMPFGFKINSDLIKHCYQTLKNENPITVSDWAKKCSVSECYLRRIWNDWFSIKPKHTLFLYQLFKEAIAFCNLQFKKTNGIHTCNSIYGNWDENKFLKQKKYYKLNLEILSRTIRSLSKC